MSHIIDNIMQPEFLFQVAMLDFIPLVACIFLITFIILNNPYEKSIIQSFKWDIICIFLLIIVDNMDLYNITYKVGTISQIITSICGYNLRLLILLITIGVMIRREKVTKTKLGLLFAPWFVTFCTCLTAFSTHLMFWYENNEIHRGPLSYVPHIACLLYGIFTIGYGIKLIMQKDRKDEGILVIIIIISMLLATLMETAWQVRGLLISLISLAITFYYLFMYIDHFKFDELTDVFNKASFNADITKLKDKITALISVDLNGLKSINDKFGHLEGDLAIKTIAKSMKNSITRNANIYRVGGDEFFLICVEMDKDAIERMINRIKAEVARTKYTCSIGICMWESGMEFKEVYDKADENMYKEKRKFKNLIKQ